MDSIFQQITEWLKEVIISAIMGNLSGMFESVNTQVGEIATSVGMTPANFSPEVFAMLNQASEDRNILAQRLNISPHQLSYVTNSGEGEGLLFYGNVILPFVDRFPKDLELYRIMTTKLNEVTKEKEA